MSVRAKFKFTRYETCMSSRAKQDADGNHVKNEKGAFVYEEVELRTLCFQPVYSTVPGSENKKFWDSSPSGEVKLGTVNPEAWKEFELGKEYYLDFSPAPAG